MVDVERLVLTPYLIMLLHELIRNEFSIDGSNLVYVGELVYHYLPKILVCAHIIEFDGYRAMFKKWRIVKLQNPAYMNFPEELIYHLKILEIVQVIIPEIKAP